MTNTRIARVAADLAKSEVDALVLTPGADLRYLIGYDALPLERLTALCIRRDASAFLIVPHLERPAAEDAQVGVPIQTWQETDDAVAVLKSWLGPVNSIAVGNQMTVERAYRLADAFGVTPVLAHGLIANLRAIKDADEIAAITQAGAAIDRVHARVPKFLRAGRTEREIGADIARAIVEEGHARADFVIVASGPNGASPHHEVSDRVISVGEPIVIDIGGTMPSGYCSDSTRMYCVGTPTQEFLEHYEVLVAAQLAARLAAIPGVLAEQVDWAAREVLTSAGLGDFFIHRTGHGIGLETHEDPYLVAGNKAPLVAGNAFSIEPGFYLPGKFGARIEDIMVMTTDGSQSVNASSYELVQV